MFKSKLTILVILCVFLFSACEDENPTAPDQSVQISQVTCDETAVTVIDTVKLECKAASTGTLHYHWNLSGPSIVEKANPAEPFDFGKWIKWHPSNSGSHTIDVVAYLSAGDHPNYGSGEWLTYIEYDIYGNIRRRHCFDYAEKGKLWDKKSMTITVDNYSKFAFVKHALDGGFAGASSAYAADLNDDQDMDVLGTAESANVVAWWENMGSKDFDKHVIDGTLQGATSVLASDMDTDNDIDVIVSGDIYSTAWWENDGSGNFSEHVIDEYDGAEQIRVADLDGDNDLDVVGAMQTYGEIVWWQNNGANTFALLTIEDNFNFASAVDAADVDGDGDADVVGAAKYGKEIVWWENDGGGLFTKHAVDGDSQWPSSLVAIDFDGDTDVDIIAGEQLSTGNGIVWYENDGSNNFTKYPIDTNIPPAKSVFVVDMDNDGDLDVVAAVNNNETSWWENKGSRIFVKSTIDDDFDGANFVHATDIDGDGDVDVIGTAGTSGEICWWESLLIQ